MASITGGMSFARSWWDWGIQDKELHTLSGNNCTLAKWNKTQ